MALGLALAASPRAAAAASPLGLEIEPLLGPASPGVDGWMSAQVRVENRTAEVLRGTVSVEAEVVWSRGSGGPHNVTDLPFSVAPHAEVTLEVPVHGFPGTAPSLRARARSTDGQLLAETQNSELHPHDPFIFDLGSPSHFATAVRALSVPISNNRWGGLTSPNVSV